jgi:hypothetical protein
MTGRIMGERVHAARQDPVPEVRLLQPHMTKHLTCYHCPEEFTGRGMWGAYSRHLRTTHR